MNLQALSIPLEAAVHGIGEGDLQQLAQLVPGRVVGQEKADFETSSELWPQDGYGDGSKPWYLVNPKIAGKWMFIPLKMYL